MLLGCLKTLQRPYQILDWYWALAFLWQNNNIAKCADGRVGKPHSKGSKFLVSKCLYCFSPDWLEKPPHSSHFPKCYSKRHQKPFVRQMSCRSWEKVAVKYLNKILVFLLFNCSVFPRVNQTFCIVKKFLKVKKKLLCYFFKWIVVFVDLHFWKKALFCEKCWNFILLYSDENGSYRYIVNY